MAAWIALQTFVEKYASIAALAPRHKENEVMAFGKGCNGWHTVGYLSANGVEATEGSIWCHVCLYEVDDLVELVEVLGGL